VDSTDFGEEGVGIFNLQIVNLFFAYLGLNGNDGRSFQIWTDKHNVTHLQVFRFYPLCTFQAELLFAGGSNCLHHSGQITLHFTRGDAQDSQSKRAQECVSCLVMCLGFRRAMRYVAVYFDNKLSLTAVKIRDVGAKGMLPAELDAQRLAPQNLPELVFGGTHLASQLLTTFKV